MAAKDKQPFILDFVHSNIWKYSGTLYEDEADPDGVNLKIRENVTSILGDNGFFGGNKKEYPYTLDPQKNVKKIPERNMWILIPTKDLEGLSEQDYKNSFYKNHIKPDEDELLEELREENRKLRKKKNNLERQLNQEVEEEEETLDVEGNSGPIMLRCKACSNESRKSSWEDDEKEGEDYCPNCGQGVKQNAQEV